MTATGPEEMRVRQGPTGAEKEKMAVRGTMRAAGVAGVAGAVNRGKEGAACLASSIINIKCSTVRRKCW
jgi:hypothetical protein